MLMKLINNIRDGKKEILYCVVIIYAIIFSNSVINGSPIFETIKDLTNNAGTITVGCLMPIAFLLLTNIMTNMLTARKFIIRNDEEIKELSRRLDHIIKKDDGFDEYCEVVKQIQFKIKLLKGENRYVRRAALSPVILDI